MPVARPFEVTGSSLSTRGGTTTFGHIGLFGSFALVVNNISGPGLLDFAAAFQRAGWLPSVSVILIVACLSACVATMFCDAMARVEAKDPAKYRKDRLEFSAIFDAVLGRRWFAVTQWLFFLNLLSQNVAAIVATAQATDVLIATVWGRSVGVDPRGWVEWSADGCDALGCAPFHVDGATTDESPLLVTVGYVLCFATLAPLGLISLEENMLAQKVSFVLLCALCAQFLYTFSLTNGAGRVPAVGTKARDLLGVVMFNFAFCVTVPSWINEKDRSVDARKIIWTACLSSALGYVVLGWAGGAAYAKASDNVLAELTSPSSPFATQVCGGIFAFAIIGLGIPIFCILMRYNLVEGKVCSPRVGSFLGAWLPWLISFTTYRGHGILGLLSWSGLVLNSFVDFIFPMVAVIACLTVASGGGRRTKPTTPTTNGGAAAVGAAEEEGEEETTPARDSLLLDHNASAAPRRPSENSALVRGDVDDVVPDGHAPLPSSLIPYYVTIARAVLAFVVVLVSIGLALKLGYGLKYYLRRQRMSGSTSNVTLRR